MEPDDTSDGEDLLRVLPATPMPGGSLTAKDQPLQKNSDKANQTFLDPDCIVTEAELADLLGITAQRLRTLHRDGVVRRAAPARYRLREALRAYTGGLRDKVAAAGRPVTSGDDLKAEKIRQTREAADKLALANAAARGEMVAVADVAREWADVLRTVRAALLALPSRVGSRLGHLTAHDLSEMDLEIRATLAELSGSDHGN